MRIPRRLPAALGALLVSSGLAVASPLLASPAAATQLVGDGGFEAATGDPAVSPAWGGEDSEHGSAVCRKATCSGYAVKAAPRTGSAWAWFGNSAMDGHTADIHQTVSIPQGAASLTYWYRNGEVSVAVGAHLDVMVDGQVLRRHNEATVADPGYALQSIDVSEFADGSAHTLSFEYVNESGTANSMTVDDIALDTSAGPAGVNADPGSLGAIPDANGCDGIATAGPPRDVTFQVSGRTGHPTSVGVRVAFGPSHTYAGDVVGTLTSPDGRRTVIFAPDRDDAVGVLTGPYLFSDAAPLEPSFHAAAKSAVVPPGHYRGGGTTALTITPTFASMPDANGTWTLQVRDFCDDDTGGLSAATLFVATDGVPLVTDAASADTAAPDTEFVKSPHNGIAASFKVPFGFVSTEAGSTYLCSLDGAAFAACANPTTVSVTAGKHSFRVVARDQAGNTDPYPAMSTFAAYDCASLTKAVSTVAEKLKTVKKAVKKTKAQLVEAQQAGDEAEVAKLRTKLTKLAKLEARRTKKLAAATAKAEPCTVQRAP